MLSAKRKSDGETVLAYFEKKSNGPFVCLDCQDEVVLKSGRNRIEHFAHVNPLTCQNSIGESDLHRFCKAEIFRALQNDPRVTELALEREMGPVRPDIFALINGTPVAIEVQISSLSLETITERTIWYARKGIYVLWLLQWTPRLNAKRYAPKIWERWIHACYFGRVYYWLEAASVARYSFEPCLKSVPKTNWLSQKGTAVTSGGYSRRLKRFRTPIRGEELDLVGDFGPKERFWWEGGGLTVPDACLYINIDRQYTER